MPFSKYIDGKMYYEAGHGYYRKAEAVSKAKVLRKKEGISCRIIRETSNMGDAIYRIYCRK